MLVDEWREVYTGRQNTDSHQHTLIGKREGTSTPTYLEKEKYLPYNEEVSSYIHYFIRFP